jgi:hypothetical protein
MGTVLDAPDAILALLFDEKGPEYSRLDGLTRLTKLLFLARMEYPHLAKHLPDFDFEAWRMGPWSHDVYDALEALGIEERIQQSDSGIQDDFDDDEQEFFRSQSDVLRLVSQPKRANQPVRLEIPTSKYQQAKEVFKSLSPEARRELKALKDSFRNMSLRELLQFVYRKYPQFTTRSKILEDLER